VAKVFVTDIQPGQEVSSVFAVAEKQLRVARNGSPFLTLKLLDKTGSITGRIWENAEHASQSISLRTPVCIRGKSELFRDELQIQVQAYSPVSPAEIDPTDFLPVCPADVTALYRKLKKILATVKSPPLHQLVNHILANRDLMAGFKLAPAAKSVHHAYLGGLVEHTASIVGLVSQVCAHYPDLDRDLLIAGAFLHDIGKIQEFVYDLYIEYSDSGRLLGHMVLGTQILDEQIRIIKHFPSREALLLKHLILSHHGQTEFGAVKLPMTREAFVLHFADDLDAKMHTLSRILSESKEGDSCWTSYQPLFSRFFLKGLPEIQMDGQVPDKNEVEESAVQLSIWPPAAKKEAAP